MKLMRRQAEDMKASRYFIFFDKLRRPAMLALNKSWPKLSQSTISTSAWLLLCAVECASTQWHAVYMELHLSTTPLDQDVTKSWIHKSQDSYVFFILFAQWVLRTNSLHWKTDQLYRVILASDKSLQFTFTVIKTVQCLLDLKLVCLCAQSFQ